MPHDKSNIDIELKRKLAVARAGRGWSWRQLADALSERNWNISSGSLMTKYSRMSLKASEYVLIMQALGVGKIEIGADQLPIRPG